MKNNKMESIKKSFNKIKGGLQYIIAFVALFGTIVLLACGSVKADSETVGINGFKKISSLSLVQDGVYVFKDNATKREFLIFYNEGDMEVVFR